MIAVAGEPSSVRTADVLGALALAADLALGLPAEHVLRSCVIGMRVGDLLGLSDAERVELYYAELLMDAGCTAWTSQLAGSLLGDEIAARQQYAFFVDPWSPREMLGWLGAHVATTEPTPRRAQHVVQWAIHGRERAREGFLNTCEVASRFAWRLGMPDGVQNALRCVFEQWDGSGPRRARGEAIPITSRIVYASGFFEVFFSAGGAEAATRIARRRRRKAFDPDVVDAFVQLAEQDALWTELDQGSVWASVQALEPDSAYRHMSSDRLEEVALAFADFADLKSPDVLGHSRRVADLAERLARRLALPRRDVATIRLAGLLHDLGLVAVPSYTLAKPRQHLTESDWERLRLHPYHAERILSRVPAFGAAAALVAAHHERFDGTGYPRGASGAELPVGARILAVVDRFDELSAEYGSASALDQVMADSGRGLCPEACRTLAQELGRRSTMTAATTPVAKPLPNGLTEREVEVLRLLAQGSSRAEIATRLVLSEHTVRHHIEHIYDKLGVSTRVAAALFAVEHDLID